ncbi:MAG: mechanosensitive ion channel domain-containing protein [Litorimonas sp.]
MDTVLEYWTSASETFPFVLGLTVNLVSALCIFIIGMIVGRYVRKRIRQSKISSHLDATLKPVIASAFFYVIIAMTLYAVLIKIGVPASSLIAVFGAAGLAIGLSLKDTLSNIASGIFLLVLRPIEVGEFVDLPTTSGTVIEIGLFATTLKTAEGLYQYVPNSKVWEGRIQNYNRNETRQFRLDVGVSYDTDLRNAQAVILDVLSGAKDRIIDAPSRPEVFVMSFGDNAVNYHCRVWLPADQWLHRTSTLRIEIFEALGKAGIEIPFPQRVVTMKTNS